MNTSKPAVIVGVFERRGQAEAAIDELLHAGFRHDQLGLAAPGGRVTEATTPTEKREEKAADGAVTGAVAGGVAGAVGGALATAVFPAAGIVIAGTYLAGILAGAVGGAAAGAALGGYFGPFVAMGMTEQEASRYASALKEGRTIVVVKPEERRAEAEQILHDHGALAC
jgi:hypothetical protein